MFQLTCLDVTLLADHLELLTTVGLTLGELVDFESFQTATVLLFFGLVNLPLPTRRTSRLASAKSRRTAWLQCETRVCCFDFGSSAISPTPASCWQSTVFVCSPRKWSCSSADLVSAKLLK